jgi:hypothetical protein
MNSANTLRMGLESNKDRYFAFPSKMYSPQRPSMLEFATPYEILAANAFEMLFATPQLSIDNSHLC